MVDRITPAVTPTFLDQVEARTDLSDEAAVQTETFAQWAIEDNFPHGRPAWEKAGALLVKEVAPYENMKLRMLNGAHSLMAYAGHVACLPTVKACMDNETLRALLQRHLAAAASTLKPLPGVNYRDYAAALASRFDNPSIVHETYQIAMDGSQKMPQRVFSPTLELLADGRDFETYAFAAAAWMRYTMGRKEAGAGYALRDPLDEAMSQALRDCSTAQSILSAITGVSGLVPDALTENPVWRTLVEACLASILSLGMLGAAQHLLENHQHQADADF
jgi:fructuronate reductase